ncbi:His-Xaa-Ser system radical SAM maturase HxsC [Sphingomonas sp. BK069]|uniref:His-Xaa-Ser system radical SAM maturase HxsC n=1 Tax=Sphingomonas sp. BK069 TaxID=2586979 RepID=UPI00162217EC|nr:His-Xaa-Ser system radical SAM maturase HxsC [Sphingomonas sp. BK069]MBB3348392.1 His-Xaa-Ser system radical SAM maturase HxsC [Sphingomonas sp. BK069]
MIPLALLATCEAEEPFVVRLGEDDGVLLIDDDQEGATFATPFGLLAIDGASAGDLRGDVVMVNPREGRVDRLLRAGSPHNTLLVTERCDQLCVMCSQPPKKTHVDRFDHLEAAAMLAERDSVIGITGGEPTLYKERLLTLLENVLSARPDLSFHVLTNGQHFEAYDVARLRGKVFARVTWGIPLYAPEADLHDRIVAKPGAFVRLERSMAHLMAAGAAVELRTVLLASNFDALPSLARYVVTRLAFVRTWSIMQLENIGFARARWHELYVDHTDRFQPVADALDLAALHGVRCSLFNFPRCTVPADYREQAPASISDWKRRYAPACTGCNEQANCCGFFEWHPEEWMKTRAVAA